MPSPALARDGQGRTFAEYVADQVMAAIIAKGVSVRGVSRDTGLDRSTLQDRLNGVRPFNVHELARVAAALEVEPESLVVGFARA